MKTFILRSVNRVKKRRPTFLEGALVAFAAALSGSVLFTVLSPLTSERWVSALLVTALSFGYVLYLIARSGERVGRITTVMLWIAMATVAWFAPLPVPLYALLHLGAIWFIRSLYFHSGVLPALADLGLTGVALTVALWAGINTASPFLSIWCLFLVQALFVAIPGQGRKSGSAQALADNTDRFQCAHRAAEAAVRKLTAIG
jgi:hypothetical protein